MKKFRFAVVLAVVVLLVLTSTVCAAGPGLNMDIRYGQMVAGVAYSKVKINALPFVPSVLAVRTLNGNITWEQHVKVLKTPFGYEKNESAWLPTQYIGLNTSKGKTYLSSTWNKGLCPDGVSYNLVGNGDTMKVKITNSGKFAMNVIGVRLNIVIRPGKTVMVTGKYNSDGLGLLTKSGAYCSTINWNIPRQ